MVKEFLKGDTVDLLNISSDEYRHSKGFFISNNKWGGNETIEILYKRFIKRHHIGVEFKSMKICTCRMVLTEKSLNKSGTYDIFI